MASIPTLHLLNPDHLPRTYAGLRMAAVGHLDEILAPFVDLTLPASDVDTLLALVEIRKRLDALHIALTPHAYPDDPKQWTREEKEFFVHDEFFFVKRVGGDPLLTFLQGLVQAYCQLLTEELVVGTSLTATQWSQLRAALDALLLFLANHPASPGLNTPSYRAPRACSPSYPVIPLDRWRFGHHAFFNILQGIIIALSCFGEAAQARDHNAAQTALDLATTLMLGTGAAFRFTSDFLPEEYETIVRLAMKHPHVEISLSGLMSEDHCFLNHLTTLLQPTFLHLDPQLSQAHRQFVEAFKTAYEEHKYICERFQGGEVPSLRMNPASPKSAVQVLEKLEKSRLRNIQPAAAATRRSKSRR